MRSYKAFYLPWLLESFSVRTETSDIMWGSGLNVICNSFWQSFTILNHFYFGKFSSGTQSSKLVSFITSTVFIWYSYFFFFHSKSRARTVKAPRHHKSYSKSKSQPATVTRSRADTMDLLLYNPVIYYTTIHLQDI